MPSKTIGIIVNGATGRIASTQHLANALVPLNDRVAIGVQQRDGNQRELVIDYKLRN